MECFLNASNHNSHLKNLFGYYILKFGEMLENLQKSFSSKLPLVNLIDL